LEGTLAVASGNLQKKLPVVDKDDFSLVARSFNTMTQQLSKAQNESIESQQEVQRQHDYVYTVLDNLTSGVITLDSDYVIRRVNRAAEQLLFAPLRKYQGKTFKNVCGDIDALQPLFKDILPHLEAAKDDEKAWQTEVTLVLEGVKRTMVARGALLPELIEGAQGHVLVIEDVTDVMQAEHDAAWSEVARRLAHEIKNPLTPIQLSAERLQYRLKPLLDEESADLLQRMSHTIIQQVDTMKKMVDAFSEYARSPELRISLVDMNRLIQEVVDLYRINADGVGIVLDLDNDLPLLSVDKDRIRQLLVNVIKNAIEAMQDNQGVEKSVLRLTTKIETSEKGDKKFVLNVIDNGPGIDDELLPHLFEPYKTTKPKGSGLGLAIVKRIIEEHEGSVMAENNEERGARISIYLPIA
jgi:nitrogen fixation/metabolism regulation signal transduction histidine kinase